MPGSAEAPRDSDAIGSFLLAFAYRRNLESSLNRLGWKTALTRIQAGPLKAQYNVDDLGNCLVACASASGPLEIAGRAPASQLSWLIPYADRDLWVNGRNVGAAGGVIVPPDADVLALLRAGGRVLIVQLPTEPQDYGSPLRPVAAGRELLAEHVLSWTQGQAVAARVRRLVNETSTPPVAAEDHAAEIAFRIVSKAREHIERNLGQRIRMDDICAYAATSLSRLERTFRREWDLSPSQYVLAKRLGAVKAALESASDPHVSVAHVAHDHGFNHLGRFASVYRRHFGLLPSATLRAKLQVQA